MAFLRTLLTRVATAAALGHAALLSLPAHAAPAQLVTLVAVSYTHLTLPTICSV